MSPRTRLALALAVIVLSGASYGCSSTSSCSRDEDHIDVGGFVNADGTTFTSIDTTKLQSSDGTLPSFTYFPANRIVTFHVGLSGYPTDVNVFLSFSAEGDATVAPAAGNQSLIRKRSKDEIVLRNDTCSEFWVWLTASTSATPFHELNDAGMADDANEMGAAGAENTP